MKFFCIRRTKIEKLPSSGFVLVNVRPIEIICIYIVNKDEQNYNDVLNNIGEIKKKNPVNLLSVKQFFSILILYIKKHSFYTFENIAFNIAIQNNIMVFFFIFVFSNHCMNFIIINVIIG